MAVGMPDLPLPVAPVTMTFMMKSVCCDAV